MVRRVDSFGVPSCVHRNVVGLDIHYWLHVVALYLFSVLNGDNKIACVVTQNHDASSKEREVEIGWNKRWTIRSINDVLHIDESMFLRLPCCCCCCFPFSYVRPHLVILRLDECEAAQNQYAAPTIASGTGAAASSSITQPQYQEDSDDDDDDDVGQASGLKGSSGSGGGAAGSTKGPSSAGSSKKSEVAGGRATYEGLGLDDSDDDSD